MRAADVPPAERAADTVSSGYDVSKSSAKCAPAADGRICKITLAAPIGKDAVGVDLFDGPPASAALALVAATPQPSPKHLGSTKVVAMVAKHGPNALAFTVGGLPAKLIVTPATIVFTPLPDSGSPAPNGPAPVPTSGILTADVYVSAQDSAGLTIVGPDAYGTAIAVQLYGPSPAPVTVAGSATELLLTPAQGQPLELQYNVQVPYAAPVSLVG